MSAPTIRTPPLDLPSAEEIGAEIMERAAALAAFSEGGEGVTRRFATPEHRAASDAILGWMREAGMEAGVDAAGDTVGRYEGESPGLPALLLGSHQDTVRCGGRYDGMLGILAAISCVKALNERGVRLPFTIEVFAFGDEEGVRFRTSFIGSAAIAGGFDMADLERRDEDGISMAQAMRDFGLDPDAIPALARRPEDVLAYVEVHIEQGPVLEAADLPVGVVSALVSGTRLDVEIEGVAGHAGTVPMGRRADALAAAAEAVLAVERRCSGHDGLVGTVGRLTASPGATNVIPGGVDFSIDIRAPENATRDAAVGDVSAEIESICARRGVAARIAVANRTDASACAPWIMAQLEAAVAAEGVAPRRLYSGAGHDGQAMAAITDIGMLFVRCKRGISHNPAESITTEDAGAAARVLLRFIVGFRPPGPASES